MKLFLILRIKIYKGVKDMKINFIIPFKRMSGGIRVVYIYSNYLVSKGHDVCCYLPIVSYKGKNQNLAFRIKASLSNAIKKETWFDCQFPVKIVPLIKEKYIRDADVTIATSWQTSYDVAKLSTSKGRKFYFVQDYEVFNGEKKLVENSYKIGIPMITISKELAKRLLCFSNNVSVVNNGLFEDEYINGNKANNRKFTITFMFHEAPHKGSAEALIVINKLLNMHHDIRIQVFGRKLPTDLPNSFIKLQCPDRKDLIKAYQESDVYLFTSKIEAWGLPVVEAMANKCAVVGRKIGALDELYNGRNAEIAGNEEEMVAAVDRLYNDRELLLKIQNEGYLSTINLKWEDMCSRFEKILQM